MRLGSTFALSLRSLSRNKMRSFLTMLGIIIGVAAVIAMVSIGQGAKAAIEARISALGSNLIIIFPGTRTRGGVRTGWGSTITLSASDAQAIEREIPGVYMAAPSVRTGAQVVFGNQNWFTAVYGTIPAYQIVREWNLAEGRYFNDQELAAGAKVAVLGKSVVDNLFAGVSPLGQIIRIKRMPFRVVGVLTPKGRSGWGRDRDDSVWIPLTTMQRKIMGITHVTHISVAAVDGQVLPQVEQGINQLLRARHRIPTGKENDFTVRNVADIAEAASASSRVMTLLLAGIASVSLVVGGIGIMNIMLVSVTERTREIGIRLAVGARGKDIRLQFLVEAVVLSLVGGFIGMVMGVVASRLISNLAGWPTLISSDSIVLALAFSAAVGIFFGFYPASKAAGLDPVQALRYE